MVVSAENSVADFYKIQTRIYTVYGIWKLPAHLPQILHIIYNIHFWHVAVFWMLLFDVSCLLQLMTNIASLSEVIKVFFIFATMIGSRAKFITVKKKNDIYMALFQSIYSGDFPPITSDENMILKSNQRISRFVRNSYTSISLTAVNGLAVMQLISDKTELPASLYIPFNVDATWIYCLVYIYEYLALSTCCVMNIAFDSLSSSLFVYLKGQLDILSHRLENIGKDPIDSQELINLQLKDCMRYYLRILGLKIKLENLLSVPMSIQILCSVLVLIANFYGMSYLSGPGEYSIFVKYLIYQVCMLAQIFILCYYSNEVSLKSIELSQALYRSNWISWNKANRKLLLVMMIQFDNPITIKTINSCYSFNLAAFTSIVNSSYSYFALLKNING